jgi:hypothetical protein
MYKVNSVGEFINNYIHEKCGARESFTIWFSLDKNSTPTRGYIVGVRPYKSNEPSIASLQIYDGIGGWYDPKTRFYEIDLVRVIQDKEEAISFAKYYNQKSIYNIENDEVIYLTPKENEKV